MKKISLILPLIFVACSAHIQTSAQTVPPAPAASPAPVTPAPKPPHVHVDKHEAFMLETPNLEKFRRTEIASLTVEQIEARNDADIKAFSEFIPQARVTGKTGGEIDFDSATRVLQGINENPVVGPYVEKYQRPNVRIGYCFGRATFVHLALKKMGLQTSSIRKLWLVGPMTSGVNWAFHVATAAYITGQGWMVIDSNLPNVVNVRDWFDHYSYMSSDRKLRIYFTNPDRFGVTIPKYDRVDLGLTLPAERDWYSHYFYDLMAWLRTADFKALGFARVTPTTVERAASATAANDIYSKP